MSNGGQSRSSSSFHFFAGLSSGVLSAVLLQPADLLKTRVQQSHSTTLTATVRTILAGPHPVRQLWRGTVPSALRTGIGSALYFSTLNALRQRVAQSSVALPTTTTSEEKNNGGGGSGGAKAASHHSSSLPKLSSMANLTTGAVARASAGFVMMPITVIKVRFESSYYAYRSLWHAGSDMYKTHGLRGFFAGFGATAVRDAPYAGLYVLFYEESKRRLSVLATLTAADGMPSSSSSSGDAGTRLVPGLSASAAASVNFASGVVAACLGTALTNPFDAIKTRLQLLPERYVNMAQAARLMLREEGPRTLFDGLGIRIARKAVSSALAWTLYEELIRRADGRWRAEAVI